jgi:hypothetical protein
LVVIIDLVAIFVGRRIGGALLYGYIGLMAMLAYHFINSDFFTVLGSHGGVAAFAICFLLSMLFGKRKQH